MDQQIKERVVGAAVLVLAAVIFIPMILAGSPQERGDVRQAASVMERAPTPGVAARAPSAPDAGGFSTQIRPLGGAPPAPVEAPEVVVEAAPDGTDKPPPAPRAAPVVKAAQKAPVAATSPSPRQSPAAGGQPAPRKAVATPQPAVVKDGWVVQLGSFASASNAHALRDRLTAKGYKAFVRASGKGSDAVTRVYVGPEATREGARRHVGRLFAETRLQGIVIAYPK